MIRILSWDCGYKSLAYTLIEINYNLLKKINDQITTIIHEYDPANIDKFVEKLPLLTEINLQIPDICVVECDVVDLLPGKMKDFTEIERTIFFKKWMSTFKYSDISDSIVLIEQQPDKISRFNKFGSTESTTESSVIANQLVYHYCIANNVIYISPKLKNVDIYPGIKLADSESKYKSKYVARKKHSEHNFNYISGKMGLDFDIPNRLRHNAADSFMQIIVWLRSIHKNRK